MFQSFTIVATNDGFEIVSQIRLIIFFSGSAWKKLSSLWTWCVFVWLPILKVLWSPPYHNCWSIHYDCARMTKSIHSMKPFTAKPCSRTGPDLWSWEDRLWRSILSRSFAMWLSSFGVMRVVLASTAPRPAVDAWKNRLIWAHPISRHAALLWGRSMLTKTLLRCVTFTQENMRDWDSTKKPETICCYSFKAMGILQPYCLRLNHNIWRSEQSMMV